MGAEQSSNNFQGHTLLQRHMSDYHQAPQRSRSGDGGGGGPKIENRGSSSSRSDITQSLPYRHKLSQPTSVDKTLYKLIHQCYYLTEPENIDLNVLVNSRITNPFQFLGLMKILF